MSLKKCKCGQLIEAHIKECMICRFLEQQEEIQQLKQQLEDRNEIDEAQSNSTHELNKENSELKAQLKDAEDIFINFGTEGVVLAPTWKKLREYKEKYKE